MGLLHSAQNSIKLTRAFRILNSVRQKRRYRDWLVTGQPDPPPALAKHQIIREHAMRFNTPVFVETGTYLGDTIHAVFDDFEELYTIELSESLFRMAKKRFARSLNVTVLQGDSGEVLAKLLPTITRPSLFWLDAHFSDGVTARGSLDTPLYKELDLILRHPLARQHVVLIDDARFLTGHDGYPSAEALRDRIASAGFGSCDIKNDIARIFA